MIETELKEVNNSRYIEISWQNDSTAFKYEISKRTNANDEFEIISELTGAATSYNDVEVNQYQEYEVRKRFRYDDKNNSTKSYKEHCIDCNLVEEKTKTLLILVDNSHYTAIESNLELYTQTVRKEGWNSIIKKVDRVETFNPKAVINNKLLINQVYENSSNLKAILILGRVAVPYSGNVAPDGHGDKDPRPHKGAYPTDSYYADLDYNDWTDSVEINEKSSFPRQHNIINDGKWDQSFIPGKVELAVGRVDFYNLPEFGESESGLLNRYLEKVIAYKSGATVPVYKAILYDGFAEYSRGYAADGWNNMSAIYGKENIFEMPVRDELYQNRYDMLYAGAPGDFNNIYLAVYYNELAFKEYLATHSMIFGSYNVDWDSENNLHRSIIASEGFGLTSIWASFPHWTYFKLGLGRTFGEALTSTQNNRLEYDYPFSAYRSGVYTFLAGDPTLKLINENAISNINISDSDYNNLNLELIDDKSIWGYQILNASGALKIEESIFFDEPKSGIVSAFYSFNSGDDYILRPIIKINNRSGSFFYLGNGIEVE
jgi:hypothetical protein